MDSANLSLSVCKPCRRNYLKKRAVKRKLHRLQPARTAVTVWYFGTLRSGSMSTVRCVLPRPDGRLNSGALYGKLASVFSSPVVGNDIATGRAASRHGDCPRVQRRVLTFTGSRRLRHAAVLSRKRHSPASQEHHARWGICRGSSGLNLTIIFNRRMRCQPQAKAHPSVNGHLRNTSPEIAEAIFSRRSTTKNGGKRFGKKSGDKVLIKAFAKTDKFAFGANGPSNVKHLTSDSPLHAGISSFNTSNLSIGQNRWHLSGSSNSITRCAGACRLTSALRNCRTLGIFNFHQVAIGAVMPALGKRCRQSACVRF